MKQWKFILKWLLWLFGREIIETEVPNGLMAEEMFLSLSNNLDRLCLSRLEIALWKANIDLDKDKDCVFLFLFKKGKAYMVKYICVYSGGLFVGVYRLEDGGVGDGEDRRRVVVPQLIPLAE